MRSRAVPLLALCVALAAGAAACGTEGAGSPSGRSASVRGSPVHAASPKASASGSVGQGAANGGGGATLGAAVRPLAPDVIETASVDLRAASATEMRDDVASLTGLAAGDGGYVESSAVGLRTASLVLRVPNATLSAALVDVAGMGTVTSRRTSGQDVTGQVVDLAAEETNLQSEENAVRRILDRASKVSDILTIQQQLFALQGEVAQLQAQRNSLANQVQYATLSVGLSLPAGVGLPGRPHRPGTVVRFWNLARSHTVDAIRGVVLAVGWAAPALLVLLAAAGAYALLRRRRHQPASDL